MKKRYKEKPKNMTDGKVYYTLEYAPPMEVDELYGKQTPAFS